MPEFRGKSGYFRRFLPVFDTLRDGQVRQVQHSQMEIGEVCIEDIELNPKSRDDTPALLAVLAMNVHRLGLLLVRKRRKRLKCAA
ncbi:MAG: hypothetical protein OXD44_11210 [Gammaproteobacteria bacterium]|nr:hypothetical protein [Gammaproteobacteria bacterium]